MINFKLNNPIEFEFLNKLRNSMGARLIESTGEQIITRLLDPVLIEKLGKEGIELNDFAEIISEADGTLGYKGQRVVVYIRDVMFKRDLPRFHIAFCDKLTEMKSNNRFQRYVASNQNYKKFVINTNGYEKSEELDVCKKCLSQLKWKGYSSHDSWILKNKIVKEFSLIDFFKVYPKNLIKTLPKHTTDTAPVNEYTKDFDEVRKKIIEKRGTNCEECNLNLRYDLKNLHVHHINAIRYDNSEENLKLLCYYCHSEQYNHVHMKNSKDYEAFIKKYCPWLI
ncbi:MAG: HNH endonuclease [Sphingobacteriia bacterium]|nr:HNH endonuclease [Sphingobacteriia bacterium]